MNFSSRLTLALLFWPLLSFAGNFKSFVPSGDKMFGSITINPFTQATAANYLLRLNADGTLDSAFGGTGKIDFNFIANPSFLLAPDFVVQDSGKVVVASAGCARLAAGGTECTQFVARYDATGVLDSTFGDPATPGRIVSVSKSSYANSPAVFSQGKFLLVAHPKLLSSGSQDWELRRYSEDGAPDGTFGTAGFVSLGNGQARLVQTDGRILVSRWVANGSSTVALLERFTADGAPDKSFAGGSLTLLDVPYFSSVAQQPDGKLLVVGSEGSPSNLKILRLNADGTNDTSFGAKSMASLPSTYTETAHSVSLAPDGSILVGASRYLIQAGKYLGTQCLVAKFEASGKPDATFGAGGYNILLFNPGAVESVETVQVAAVQDGLIVQARAVLQNQYYLQFARLDGGGSLDPAFGQNGIVVVP